MASSVDVRSRLRSQMEAIEADLCPCVDEGIAGGRAWVDDGPDDAERAFRKIERLARVREQASTALRRRLLREGFCAEAVERALTRGLACGLIDDARYAEVYVRSRLGQGRGRRGIAAELADLDIASAVISELLGAGEDDVDEVARALAVLERKPPSAKNRREGAYRRLMQKGYGASVAATAARRWSESDVD